MPRVLKEFLKTTAWGKNGQKLLTYLDGNPRAIQEMIEVLTKEIATKEKYEKKMRNL